MFDIIDGILEDVSNTFFEIKDSVANDYVGQTLNSGLSFFDIIPASIKSAIDQLPTILNNIKDSILNLPNNLASEFSQLFESVKIGVSDKITELSEILSLTLENVFSEINNRLNGIFEGMKLIGSDLIDFFNSAFTNLLNSLNDIKIILIAELQNFADKITHSFTFIQSEIRNLGSVFENKLAELSNSIKLALNQMLNGIEQTLNEIFNPIAKAIFELKDKIADALTFDADKAVSLMLEMQAKLQSKMREELVKRLGEQI